MQNYIKDLIESEEYSGIDNIWKELFIIECSLEAVLIISDEKSKVKEDSNFFNIYENIIKEVESECFINDTLKGKVKTDFIDKDRNAKEFIFDVKKSIVKSLDKHAEYQQLILIPNTMETYAAFKRCSGLLKKHFGISDSDLISKPKF